MMRNAFIIFVVAGGLMLTACGDKGTNPADDANQALSTEEQAQIVASQVAEENGGIMMEVSNVSGMSDGNAPALGKPAAWDTTITRDNLTYQVSLSFYSRLGQELPKFMPTQTDSIKYTGILTGELAARLSSIKVNSNTSLGVGAILSRTIRINGVSNGTSDFSFSGPSVKTSIKANRTLKVNNVKVPLEADDYIPVSGTIEGNIKGTYKHQGVRVQGEGDFEINFTLTFNGDDTATVELGNGATFKLNLKTGEITVD